ncbi:MAG: LPS export ABC transporter ATP-binding protein [Candidatus Eisenbacteria bacterium]|uniref:LPS export ABC transporter ATP-binding protein n=1 Tax=Eiseniibacteriota bacterium TaxID=2212470 RepID=A0A7Y2E9T2_UNCEI|nr:LPS export ABC transporter ATP-binding protein [Candidatus Eisenbacteria bacterium]
MQSTDALRAENLERYYGKLHVVKGVSVEVNPGEVVGLLGPNGAGKTTTFYMIVGFLKANSGSIYLGERNITRMAMYQRARLGMGYLPQDASVFRKLSVRENIMAILQTLGIPKKEQVARLDRLLAELDIAKLADRKGYNLSGGERRRVEITRALVTEPKFLLLDEPFVGIDPIAVAEIQEIILRLKERGLGILITDHSVRETLRTTDRAYILFEGKIILSGTSEELAENPMARKVYLGERFQL